MEKCNNLIARSSRSFNKLWVALLPIAFCALFGAQGALAQGGSCNQISFNFVNYEPCKFRLTYNNMTDCYTDILVTLSQGDFQNFSANMPAGFSVEVFGQSQLRITHVNGFLPLGNQAPLIFTLPVGLVTSAAVAYNDQCGMVGCNIFPGSILESCPDPMNASIIGVKYRECGVLPYSNQSTIQDWTIELQDTMGNILSEQVTNVDGQYGFFDLPAGSYRVKEKPKPGWTAKVPAAGMLAFTLNASQQRVANFGNCPPCSCDSIYLDVVQLEGTSDTSQYFLSVSNGGAQCFPSVRIVIDTGTLLNWNLLLPNWEVTSQGSGILLLTPPSSYIPVGSNIPLSFYLTGTGTHAISVTSAYNTGMNNVECKRLFAFPSPPIIIDKGCCPANSTPGQEQILNGGFTSGVSNFTWAIPTYMSGVVSSPGHFTVTDGNNISANNSQFVCVGKTGSPFDNFLIVDASTVSSTYVWEQQVTVTANTYYAFCAYFKNIVRPGANLSNPVVVLEILNSSNAVVAVSTPITLVEGQPWKKVDIGWTPLLTGTYKLHIRPVSTAHIGNDFAVDCISFRSCSFLPSLVCACPVNSAVSNNLISNGDFSQGPFSGFTTQLAGPTLCGQGNYNVLGSLDAFCPGAWPVTPARSAPWMLCIDGRSNGNQPTVLWQSQVALTQNKNYCFSFFWTPAFGVSQQNIPIDIVIVDAAGNPVNLPGLPPILASGNLSGATLSWHPRSYNWTTGIFPVGTYFIALRQTSGGSTRDFGIDDICMTKEPDPCSVSVATTINNCTSVTWTASPNGPGPYTYQWSHGQNTQMITTSVLPCQAATCTVTVTCADGSTSTASGTITTTDNTPPTVICPMNLTVQGVLNPNGICSGSVWGIGATATDNCGIQSLTYSINNGPQLSGDASGTNFNMGSTLVTYTATDWCGNKATCTFFVTIECHNCFCAPPNIQGNELVVNGNFSTGGGFSSTYTNNCSGQLEGQYCVSASPSNVNAGFSPCTDVTSGNGGMLVVNGSTTAGRDVWCQTFTVLPNTDYIFSYWIASLTAASPAQMQMYVNGLPYGSICQATANVCGWKQCCQTWNSGINTIVTICLKDINLASQGNDFALDEISFRSCKSPCTADFGNPTTNGCGQYTFTGFANNGTGPYTYCWTFNGIPQPPSTSSIITVTLPPGAATVSLTIKDAVGCTATYSSSYNIPAYTLPVLALTSSPASVCPGSSAQLSASATGGNPAYNYTWSNPPGGTGTPKTVTPTGTTTYTATVTDANGCTATATKTVVVYPKPNVNAGPDQMVCSGQSAQLSATGSGGTPPLTYVWNPGNLPNPATVSPLANTTYTVVVTDANGCTEFDQMTVVVKPNPMASAGTDKLICQWQTATLTAAGGGTYQWSPNGTSANPYTTAPVQANTTYTVTVTGTNGCTATDQVNVSIKICDCVTNTIVQNGDFSNSNPCLLNDQDIQNAAFWSPIWPNGYSTGDLYDANLCANAAVTPLSQGPYAGIWCKPHTQIVWREGILNTLSTPITKNSGTYMVNMKLACVYVQAGLARLQVYGVGVNAVSAVTAPSGSNPLTNALLNTTLFQGPAGGQLLGTYYLDNNNCSSNFTQFTFNFNSNLLVDDIDRIYITRDDGPGGTTYTNIDDVCIKPVFDSTVCDCGPLNFANMYRPQDGWISPIGASQSAITAPCPKPASSYYIFGQYQCAPDQCGNNCVDWKLDRPGPLPDLTGQNCGAAYPWFVIPINNADCSQSGNYALTITRMCGSKPCSKVFNFKLDNCSCPCDSLKRDVGYGFSMASVLLPTNQCRKRFKPLALCPNDVVQWSITASNGTYNAAGTSTGNANFQFSTPFQNSGYYRVCMLVTRTEPNGTVCQWEHCRTVYIKCGIDPVGSTTRFCEENEVKNGGFNEGSSPGLLNEWGYLSDWEKAPNTGDGSVIVEDTSAAGSLEEGYVLMLGRKDNFAGIMQEVNLQPDNYLTLYFDAHNYQGADLPAGTRIEVRLQDSPFPYPGLKKQVLKVQMMIDSSGWHQIGGVTGTMLDTSLHYLVICLQNDDPIRNSVVGIDNIELCSSATSAAPEPGQKPNLRLRIFPNPNAGTFTVALPDLPSAGMTLRIMDIAGRLLQEQQADRGSRQQTVQAKDLPDGLYFLQVVTDGKVLGVEKFVKQ